MALPDELSAANIAILVSKSAAEAVRMKLAYDALFRILRSCIGIGLSHVPISGRMRDVAKEKKRKTKEQQETIS